MKYKPVYACGICGKHLPGNFYWASYGGYGQHVCSLQCKKKWVDKVKTQAKENLSGPEESVEKPNTAKPTKPKPTERLPTVTVAAIGREASNKIDLSDFLAVADLLEPGVEASKALAEVNTSHSVTYRIAVESAYLEKGINKLHSSENRTAIDSDTALAEKFGLKALLNRKEFPEKLDIEPNHERLSGASIKRIGSWREIDETD